MAREDTLRKIKALLAKRGAEGTTPEEVAAATKLAAKLLEREGLTMTELEREADAEAADFHELWRGRGRSLPAWIGSLAGVVCRIAGCTELKNGNRLDAFGPPHAVEAAKILHAYCAAAIEAQTKALGRGRGRTWANNFRHGCVAGIKGAAEEAREEARRDAGALVVCDRSGEMALLMTAKLRADGWKIRKSCWSARLDRDGRETGIAEGGRIYRGRRAGHIA